MTIGAGHLQQSYRADMGCTTECPRLCQSGRSPLMDFGAHVHQQRNEISSDSAFVMTEPNRQLEGVGFRSDPNMQNIRILKGASGMARGVTTEAAPAPPTPAPVVPKR